MEAENFEQDPDPREPEAEPAPDSDYKSPVSISNDGTRVKFFGVSIRKIMDLSTFLSLAHGIWSNWNSDLVMPDIAIPLNDFFMLATALEVYYTSLRGRPRRITRDMLALRLEHDEDFRYSTSTKMVHVRRRVVEINGFAFVNKRIQENPHRMVGALKEYLQKCGYLSHPHIGNIGRHFCPGKEEEVLSQLLNCPKVVSFTDPEKAYCQWYRPFNPFELR